MPHLVIANDLPDPLGNKQAIADLLQEAFRRCPGSWMLHLHRAHVPTWWSIVIVRAEDGFRRTLVLDPTKQTPAFVAGAVEAILREIS
jgi:hypothetical protein